MSLTITEQLKVIEGAIKPEGYQLVDMVFQAAVNYAFGFYDSVKSFPTDDGNGNPINSEAESYRSKMLRACNWAVRAELDRNQGGVTGTLKRVFVSVVGLSQYTFTQVENATIPQWETFIVDNILEVMENLSGVTKYEADAYNAL